MSGLVEVLAAHAGVNSTAGWEGSPDPTNHRNVRRVCKCGEVIGWHDRSRQRDGHWYALSGSPFDEPHRAHVAAAILDHLRAVAADSGWLAEPAIRAYLDALDPARPSDTGCREAGDGQER